MFLDKSLLQRIYDILGLVFTKMNNTYIPAHTIFISLVIKSLGISACVLLVEYMGKLFNDF